MWDHMPTRKSNQCNRQATKAIASGQSSLGCCALFAYSLVQRHACLRLLATPVSKALAGGKHAAMRLSSARRAALEAYAPDEQHPLTHQSSTGMLGPDSSTGMYRTISLGSDTSAAGEAAVAAATAVHGRVQAEPAAYTAFSTTSNVDQGYLHIGFQEGGGFIGLKSAVRKTHGSLAAGLAASDADLAPVGAAKVNVHPVHVRGVIGAAAPGAAGPAQRVTSAGSASAAAAAASGAAGGVVVVKPAQPVFEDMVPWYSGTSADLIKVRTACIVCVRVYHGRGADTLFHFLAVGTVSLNH